MVCNLQLGVGSDHVDLLAASKGGLTVAEVTGSNVGTNMRTSVLIHSLHVNVSVCGRCCAVNPFPFLSLSLVYATVSVAEHAVMQMLALVRNFVPAYKQVINGEWDIAAIAEKAYDLEGISDSTKKRKDQPQGNGHSL
jgi:formate dehydrogenase